MDIVDANTEPTQVVKKNLAPTPLVKLVFHLEQYLKNSPTFFYSLFITKDNETNYVTLTIPKRHNQKIRQLLEKIGIKIDKTHFGKYATIIINSDSLQDQQLIASR